MKYQLGLYEKAMPDDLSWEEKLKLARKSGYDFIEISIDESDLRLSRLDWSENEIIDLLNTMNKEKIFIRSMCLSGHRKYPLGSLDEKVREKSLEIAKKSIDLADRLGVRIIQLAGYDVYYEEGNLSTRKYFEENLKKMVDMASAKGILLGFETMETDFMDTVEKSMNYVNKINSPYLNVYPDCGNLNNAALKYNHSILEDLEKGRGKTVALHIKETIPGKYRNMHFGEGVVDFEKVCEKSRDLGIFRFVTEFWYLGQENYEEIIKSQCDYARNVLNKYYK